MIVAVYPVLILFFLYLGYVYSLYSSVLYVEPERLDNMAGKLSGIRKRYLDELDNNPRTLLQLGTVFKSFVLILTAVVAVLLSHRIITAYNLIPYAGYLLGMAIVWILYLISIEYMPRRRVLKVSDRKILNSLRLLAVVYILFKPFMVLFRRATKYDNGEKISEDQKEDIIERAIETLADQAGVDEPLVEEDEKEMIGQIFQLDVTEVREVMVPRIDMIGIDKGSGFDEVRKLTRKFGYSRYPVYDESPDKIVGILYIKDLFTREQEGGSFDISHYVRDPYFVPEKKKISDLLATFKTDKVHIAIVVDEYGGTSGLVTLEDIMEEIFGEIQDEHDHEPYPLIRLPDNCLRVGGGVGVDKLVEELDLDYDIEEFETVGGLIYDLVGSVPSNGTILKWKDIIFEVERVEGQRIISVKAWLKQVGEV